MTSTAISPNSPASSGEMQAIDFSRAEEIHQKHELLSEYLKLKKLDAILLIDPANFAWFTAGAENTHEVNGSPIAAILITHEARVILCNNIDSGQLFDKELMGLGFLLKERPWSEGPAVLLDDVCRGRTVGCDVQRAGTIDIASDLKPFRSHYSENELARLSDFGADLSHALEATGRNFTLGATESEVAGHLAHRLIKNHIQPVSIQVMADGQGWRYRNWKYGEDRIERHCVILVKGRRAGLHVAASRTVCIDNPSEELEKVHQLATLIQATGIYFSRPDWRFQETWKRVARIYEKFGVPDEWRAAQQAELLGYTPSEKILSPDSDDSLRANYLIHWYPSVRSSKVGDTFLLTDQGVENLTPITNWPVLSVTVKGTRVDRPGILIR